MRLKSLFFLSAITLFVLIVACSSLTDPDQAYPWMSRGYEMIDASDWDVTESDTEYICSTRLKLSESEWEKYTYDLRLRCPVKSAELYIGDSIVGAVPTQGGMATIELTKLLPGRNLIRLVSADSAAWLNGTPGDAELLISRRISFDRATPRGGTFELALDHGSAEMTTFKAGVKLRNRTDSSASVLITASLAAPDGRIVSTARSNCELDTNGAIIPLKFNTLYHPKLWSPEAPLLYRWQLSLWEADNVLIDRLEGDFGVHWVSFGAGGFALNGVPSTLRAIALYSIDNSERALRELQDIKTIGANAVYFIDNPTDYQVMLCDRLGLLTICGTAASEQLRNRTSPVIFGLGDESPEIEKALKSFRERNPGAKAMFTFRESVPLAKGADAVVVNAQPGTNPFATLRKLDLAGVAALNFIQVHGADTQAPFVAEAMLNSAVELPQWVNGTIIGPYADKLKDSGEGLVDIDGNFREIRDMLASRWSKIPMVKISSVARQDPDSATIWHFRAFSNLPQAEFFVNGRSLGVAQAPFGEWRAELRSGTNTLSIEAIDTEGNTASDKLKFVVE